MKQKIQIFIPEPCQKGWQNMTPVEKGRFCASCQKKVLDFTYLSDNEIIKLVSKNDTLCVRLRENQQHRDLIKTKTKSNYFGYLATSVLAFIGLGTESLVAQEKPVIQQTDLKYLNKVNDSVKIITVTGIVKDSDGNPLPGVAIIIKNAKTGVQTDESGKYSIKAKFNDILIFSFLGYEEIIVKVNSSKINVKFKVEELHVIGTVIYR